MHKHIDNYTYLTQAPVHHVIITMAIPTIISMLVTDYTILPIHSLSVRLILRLQRQWELCFL